MSTAAKYRRVADGLLRSGSRDVVAIGKGVAFMCPCGDRQVYVTSPPHGIDFDDDGLLTLDGSCGYHANEKLNRPAGWCHFHIKAGEPKMVASAQCPGGAAVDGALRGDNPA